MGVMVIADDVSLKRSALVMRIVGWGTLLLPVTVFIYPAGVVWGSLPPGFPILCGAHPQSTLEGLHPYVWMLFGLYASWAILLILGAKDPRAAISLFDFGILANLVHAGIMIPQALIYPGEIAHLWADVPALLLVSAVLWRWRPKPAATASASLSDQQS